MRKAAILFMICLSVAGCLNRTGNRQRTVDCEDASLPENLPTDEELGGYPVTDRQAEFKEYYVTDRQIALKTQAGEVVFEDDTDAVDGYRYYYHEGTYETPNQHVVSVQYYDCFAYQMADKISGDILDFSGFPHVSPDLKYILSLYPLDTDGLRCAGVDLYRITDEGKIVLIMESKYMNWGATDDRRDAFWGSDGCFYCKARHPKVNWGNNPNCQYLRIKLSGV